MKAALTFIDHNHDIVVVDFDTTLDYVKVSKACRYFRNGAEFMATHPDFNCPVEDGFIPDFVFPSFAQLKNVL